MKDIRALMVFATQVALFYYLGPLMLILIIFAIPLTLLAILGYLLYKKIPRESPERKAMRRRIRKMLKENLSYLP